LELCIYFGFCFLNFGFNAMLSPNKSGFTNKITVNFRKSYMRVLAPGKKIGELQKR
jgi:hypothetical protein